MSTAPDEKGTAMIYEIAQLPVHTDKTEAFRQAFDAVLPLLTRARDISATSWRRASNNLMCFT
jgi:hypothetical protein